MEQTLSASKSRHLLNNRYQLGKIIGQGGMGQVFLAEDVLLGGVQVAIKFLTPTLIDARMQEDFAREARACAQLSQKSIHIVRVMDYGISEDGRPFYVMEYLEGKCLKDMLPLPIPLFLTLTRQICLGLQCAHQGTDIDGKNCLIIHRDIKPANVLVTPDPILGQLAKLLDFGVAKFLSEQGTMSRVKGFHGTLAYSSPEQIEGGNIDNRSDIYSLGVMMFEMLTGQRPWQPVSDSFGAWYRAHQFELPRSFESVNSQLNLPKKLKNLVMTCLTKSPDSRPRSVVEVLKALELIAKLDNASTLNLPSLSSQEINPVKEEPKITPPIKNNKPIQTIATAAFGSQLPLSVEQACWKVWWPKDKPIDEIVFPNLVPINQGMTTALWLMMSKDEIRNRSANVRYNEFVFITAPHPMLLWLTVLYNQKLGAKWLPCYLDMQIPQNQQIVYSLVEAERYPLIFFTLEHPHLCANVTSCYMTLNQRQTLKDWADANQNLAPSSQAQVSRRILKQQYNNLKPRILRHLESIAEASKFDVPEDATPVAYQDPWQAEKLHI